MEAEDNVAVRITQNIRGAEGNLAAGSEIGSMPIGRAMSLRDQGFAEIIGPAREPVVAVVVGASEVKPAGPAEAKPAAATSTKILNEKGEAIEPAVVAQSQTATVVVDGADAVDSAKRASRAAAK